MHKLEPGINTDDIAAEIARKELKNFYDRKNEKLKKKDS
jgi:hypothetical protein